MGLRGQEELIQCRDGLHRYALWLMRRGRDLVSREEVESLADLAMVRAWRRYLPSRGPSFGQYARPWVRGAVLDHVRREVLRQGREVVGEAVLEEADGSDLERELSHREEALALLACLDGELRELVVSHLLKDESLSSLARARGRHPAWACRRYGRALASLRASYSARADHRRRCLLRRDV